MSASLLAARWVMPVTSPPIRNGAVAVEANRLLAVGGREDLRRQFPAAPLTDLGEAAILPGLINVHSHLELTALRGRLEEPGFQRWIVQLITLKAERLTPEDLLHSARLGCLEAIRAGITTLADTADAAGTLEALIEAGLRGVVYQECFGPSPEQAPSSLALLRAKLDAHRERLSRGAGDASSRLRVGISPHAPYSVSGRLYEMATRLAIDEGLDVAIHAAESADEKLLLLEGGGAFAESFRRRGIPFDPPRCSTVQYFHRLGVLETAPLLIHGVTITEEEDQALLVSHGARLAHCPKSNAKFGHGIAPLRPWRDRGIPVGLGTDSVASNNSCDLIEEARFCALLHRAVRRQSDWPAPEEMLRLMTIEGARVLRLENEIGSLAAGKRADLAAIDLSRAHHSPHYDPAAAILFSCSARDVVLTMVEGKVLFDGRRVATLDEECVMRDARKIGERLAPPLPQR